MAYRYCSGCGVKQKEISLLDIATTYGSDEITCNNCFKPREDDNLAERIRILAAFLLQIQEKQGEQ